MSFRDLTASASRAIRDVIGQSVTVAGVAVVAQYQADHESVQMDDQGVEYVTVAPRLHVMIADLPAVPAKGDAVVVDGTTYSVVRVERDSYAAVDLDLVRAV